MIVAVVAAALLALAPHSARVDDVALAARHLRDGHPNLFHDLSPAVFQAAVDELERRADRATDDELLVGLMRLAALPGVRDGHTGIFPLDPSNRRTLHVYPVRLYTFTDGTFVVGQANGSDLLRARLVAVGGHPLDEVRAGVRPLVPHDNGSTLGLRINTYLDTAEVLHGLGLVPDLGSVTFTFERDGTRFDVPLRPITVAEYARGIGDLVHPLIAQAITGTVPPYVARANRMLWTSRLASRRVFYIAYNEVHVDPSVASRALLKAAREKRLRGVVVDLRNNPGGDNTTYGELVDALRRVSRTRRVVVVLSRTTFSAAQNFATELERVAHPVFVGEPSGGSPNLYGDADETPLPASGLALHVARIYWRFSSPDDPRTAIEPQIAVAPSSAEFFAGRDPVLAAAVQAVLAPRRLAAIRPRFAYDASRPLDLRLGHTTSTDGVTRQALTFDAGRGRKAAFWTHPAGAGPWPVVIFSPGYGADETAQLPDADRLARKGIASLTVAPPAKLLTCRAGADVKAFAAYVIGRRRALDLLRLLPGVDRTRMAAVGFSFGSAVTAALAGADHRLRGAVIQSGRAHLSTAIRVACTQLGRKKLKAYVRAYSGVDPVHFIGHAAPAWLLFQNGTRDPFSPAADVDAYVKAASTPKELRRYDAPHELDEQAADDRDAWLVRLLLG